MQWCTPTQVVLPMQRSYTTQVERAREAVPRRSHFAAAATTAEKKLQNIHLQTGKKGRLQAKVKELGLFKARLLAFKAKAEPQSRLSTQYPVKVTRTMQCKSKIINIQNQPFLAGTCVETSISNLNFWVIHKDVNVAPTHLRRGQHMSTCLSYMDDAMQAENN